MIKVNVKIDESKKVSVYIDSSNKSETKFLETKGIDLCDWFVRNHSRCSSLLDWIYTFEFYIYAEKRECGAQTAHDYMIKLGNLFSSQATEKYLKTILNNTYEKEFGGFKKIKL